MPRKSRKRSQKTKKQKLYVMRGCSKTKSCKQKKQDKSLGCSNCGPNCHCGPNCNCSHPCTGNCYLNRQKNKKHRGGSNSGCGSCGCPIAAYKMNQSGGNPSCGSCGLQSGGNFFKQASFMPGPFEGLPWGANLKQLPGMDGISNNRNYLAPFSRVIDNDPQLKMSMNASGYKTLNSMVGGSTVGGSTVGGYKYNTTDSNSNTNTDSNTNSNSHRAKSNKHRSRKHHSHRQTKSMKAGGLLPQDLVNLGSDFSFNMKSAYNALNGYNAPVNPLPYKDQLSHSLNNNRIIV
jgi:hypothetical protein